MNRYEVGDDRDTSDYETECKGCGLRFFTEDADECPNDEGDLFSVRHLVCPHCGYCNECEEFVIS